jgi:hypothetical protein
MGWDSTSAPLGSAGQHYSERDGDSRGGRGSSSGVSPCLTHGILLVATPALLGEALTHCNQCGWVGWGRSGKEGGRGWGFTPHLSGAGMMQQQPSGCGR